MSTVSTDVKLGMFSMPLHHADKDYLQTLNEDKECVILADKLGLSEFYVGEHHTSGLEKVTNPLIFFASIADATKNIRLGSGVLNLPQIHPVSLASNVAMLDQLTNGRFILGVGPGTLVTDVEAFGSIPMDVRHRMVFESLEHVIKIWTSEPPFESKGEFWNISLKDKLIPEFKVGWPPLPMQRPHPPIALTMVSPQSSTAKVAGAKGWIPISANFVNKRYLRGHWDSYAEGCASVGRVADPAEWRVVRCCLVTETSKEARDYMADPASGIAYYYKFMRHIAIAGRGALFMLKADPDATDEETTVPRILEGQVIYGSPDEVLAQLIALREEIGHFGTLIMTSHDWDRPAMWKRSMELMAKDVIPRFSKHIAESERASAGNVK
jgi:alkanesulfonate monooxygenase SsuD/methylene tetrahydromethanopterin reductase-like flavin-dependent oxidoreductase (luciferase family)